MKLPHSLNNFAAVVFDVGRVLCPIDRKPFNDYCKQVLRPEYTETAIAEFFSKHDALERANTSLEQIFFELKEYFKPEAQFDIFSHTFSNMVLPPPPKMTPLLEKLSERLLCLGLSNTCQVHMDVFLKYPAFQCFEHVFTSVEFKCRKPETDIYAKMLLAMQKLGHAVPPEKTLFIDDKLENLEGAARSGLQVAQSTSPATTTAWLEKVLA